MLKKTALFLKDGFPDAGPCPYLIDTDIDIDSLTLVLKSFYEEPSSLLSLLFPAQVHQSDDLMQDLDLSVTAELKKIKNTTF